MADYDVVQAIDSCPGISEGCLYFENYFINSRWEERPDLKKANVSCYRRLEKISLN